MSTCVLCGGKNFINVTIVSLEGPDGGPEFKVTCPASVCQTPECESQYYENNILSHVAFAITRMLLERPFLTGPQFDYCRRGLEMSWQELSRVTGDNPDDIRGLVGGTVGHVPAPWRAALKEIAVALAGCRSQPAELEIEPLDAVDSEEFDDWYLRDSDRVPSAGA